MFPDKLKQRREEQGLTQEEVAAFFGEDCSRQSVSKWERGAAFPEVEKLLVLSVKLDISLDELFSDELKYLKKGEGIDQFEISYPGIIAGLKTLATILGHLK